MKTLAIALVVLLLFIAAASLKSTGYDILGASPPETSQWRVGAKTAAIGLFYYLLTLAGIAAGTVFDALAAVDPNQRVTRRQIAKLMATAQSWRGIVASPLVFLTVYMGVASNPLSVPFILLAFQNGFFWKAVMSRLMGQQ
jgi:hypothetical protein